MSRRRAIDRRWALAPALILLGIGIFFALFEKVEEPVTSAPTGQAATDRFHAARLLLEGLGVSVEPARRLEVPADTDTALLVFADRLYVSRAGVEATLDWVARGGHLIVAAPRGDLTTLEALEEALESRSLEDQQRAAGPLLAALNLSLVLSRDPWDGPVMDEVESAPTWAQPQGEAGVEAGDPRHQVEIIDGGDGRVLTAALKRPVALVSRAQDLEWWVPPRGAPQLDGDGESEQIAASFLSFRLGGGRVTALSEAALFQNAAIGEHDHAELLWLLLRQDGDPRAARLVTAHDLPGLGELLWTYAWRVVLSGLALLAVYAWGASGRLGPLLPPPEPVRRSLAEHLAAAGRLLWRAGGHRALLAAAREGVAVRIDLAWPDAALLEGEARLAALARATGISEAVLREAIEEDLPPDKTRFTRAVATLVRLAAGAGTPAEPGARSER